MREEKPGMTTGVLDSGVGGLFVLKELVKLSPSLPFVYLADTLHFPYGEKSFSEIQALVRKNIELLVRRGVSEVLVACNTASSVLEGEGYSVPVKGIIKSSLQQAQQITENGKVGVLATEATVKSQAFEKQARVLNGKLQVYQKACPYLAPFVEQKSTLRAKSNLNEENLVKKKLIKDVTTLLDKGTDTLILACTHYLYFKPWLVRYFKKNQIACSVFPCVKSLFCEEEKQFFKKARGGLSVNQDVFLPKGSFVMVSGDVESFKEKSHRLFPDLMKGCGFFPSFIRVKHKGKGIDSHG